MHHIEDTEHGRDAAALTPSTPELPTLDAERYSAALKHLELTQQQQDELLTVVWNAMTMAVQMQWGLDSVNNIFAALFEKAVRDSDKALQQTKPTTTESEVRDDASD